MKRIVYLTLLLLLLLFCVGVAGAYEIKFTTPGEVVAGEPIILEGTSNLPSGFSTPITLYQVKPLFKEIGKKYILIREGGAWSAYFSTGDLVEGRYKLEITEDIANYPYSSDSDRVKTVEVINRSDEIRLDSPSSQAYPGAMDISGVFTLFYDKGLKVEVSGPDDYSYGPRVLLTDSAGHFQANVPVTSAGAYSVVFSDNRGGAGSFITTRIIVMNETDIGGAVSITPSSAETTQKESRVLSASAESSTLKPAYFAVDSSPGTVIISSSSGIDWKIEYVDENGNRFRIDEQGTTKPETVAIKSAGGMIYVKITPVKSTDSGVVTLTTDNAESVTVSSSAASSFGDPVPKEEGAASSPLSLLPVTAAIASLFFAARRH